MFHIENTIVNFDFIIETQHKLFVSIPFMVPKGGMLIKVKSSLCLQFYISCVNGKVVAVFEIVLTSC